MLGLLCIYEKETKKKYNLHMWNGILHENFIALEVILVCLWHSFIFFLLLVEDCIFPNCLLFHQRCVHGERKVFSYSNYIINDFFIVVFPFVWDIPYLNEFFFLFTLFYIQNCLRQSLLKSRHWIIDINLCLGIVGSFHSGINYKT